MNNLNNETALDKEVKAIIEKHRNFELKKKVRRRMTLASGSATLITLVSCLVGCSGKKKTTNELPTTSKVETSDINNNIPEVPEKTDKPEDKKIDNLKTVSLSSLGKELELPKKDTPKKEFGTVTGNVEPEKIVEDNTGTLWATPEAESKKEEVDKVVIDDKNDTLEVKPDGTVFEKEPSYEIKDETGKVVETGTLDSSSDLPDGWSYDKDTDKNLPSEEVGKYELDDDKEGIWNKANDEYQGYKDALEAVENGENVTEETIIVPMDPVVIEESEIIYYDTITNISGTNINDTISDSIITDTTVSDTTTPDYIDNPYDIINPPENTNGLYLDPISGLYFESKADYEQWVFQDYEGYNLVNGIMVSQTKEMDEALKEYIKTM